MLIDVIEKADRLASLSSLPSPAIITTLRALQTYIEKSISLLSDEHLIQNRDLLDEWELDHEYSKRDIVVCGGVVARCLKPHISSEETCPLHDEETWEALNIAAKEG